MQRLHLCPAAAKHTLNGVEKRGLKFAERVYEDLKKPEIHGKQALKRFFNQCGIQTGRRNARSHDMAPF